MQAKTEDDLLGEARDCAAIMNQYAGSAHGPSRRWSAARSSPATAWVLDIVDVAAATAKGILVTNVRDYCTEEVAATAVSLWLALAPGTLSL